MLKLDYNLKQHYSILKKINSLYLFVIMATNNNINTGGKKRSNSSPIWN
jgi:hypothetical protein